MWYKKLCYKIEFESQGQHLKCVCVTLGNLVSVKFSLSLPSISLSETQILHILHEYRERKKKERREEEERKRKQKKTEKKKLGIVLIL